MDGEVNPVASAEADLDSPVSSPPPEESAQAAESPGDSAPAPSPRPRRLPGEVRFSDRVEPRQRRRADLFDLIVSLLAIGAIWAIGVFANSTTQGVTEDVLRFRFIREVLLLPITLVEGTVVLFAPIAIVLALALRRRLTAILQSVGTAILAALIGTGVLWSASLLPENVTAPLRVAKAVAVQGNTTSTAIAINIVVITLCALFTAAGEAQNMKTVRWSWAGMWVIVFLGVLRSSMTLPGAFISVFIGRAVGCSARWIFGFEDRRASGADIVGALLDIGTVPVQIVRTDLDTSEEPLTTRTVVEDRRSRLRIIDRATASADYTVTRRPDQDRNRHYQALLDNGRTVEVVVLDPGREILGTIVDVWNNIRLRGLSRWISPSLKATAERSALVAISAKRAGVRTPELIGIARAGDSLVSVSEALPPTTPLHELPGSVLSDEMLDDAWRQLLAAHSRGISHRDLGFDSLVVDEDGDLWILDWERGEVAGTELNRRIDIAQMLVHQALCAGEERALESARRIVDARALESAVPVIQGAVLPSSLNQSLKRSALVEGLRAGVLGADEGEAVELTNVRRFEPRTVIMVAVLFVALVVVLGSLNFEDITAAITEANPWWMAAAFGLACLTWVGGAIPLMALSPVRLRFSDAVVAQVAASLATIVAPAGVGPAVVNLRLLKKKKVSTVVAATTVTLQQLLQLFIMLSLLLLVMVLSGNSLSVQLPYGTILAVAALVIAGIGIALSVPRFRRWVWSKVEPTWTQVFPRLIWIVGRPHRIAAILAGNLLMNIGFIGAFWAGLVAMGGSLDFLSLALTYLASNSLGSVIPSPGGIGPVEAALTAGLQVAGIPLSIGLPTAVLYRLVTFYGRIPFGWLAMKWMERKDLL
ncbi:MAG: lysylphosphatidylglycerol synthase domain-containing protein [Schaalia hyovaginalis]|uniref:lysylphosphatidylglycerol synthase domain-containing protein n=1 Tax=Schaalia hyovaginalis TaxID=29316 RepID=UPI0023F74F4E|nr:lysylphosphatidylglycerol synthase domain-containing protein [Schaalia hyovaginalis]MCI7671613.1 lysylphosphatidylglycerol synthase domain-containing protein [Schaalia hyovaginalis]MDY5506433.1 lysylphosphatidylglycerol synthase domain-containing protein [Schaalia hyovaginalis]